MPDSRTIFLTGATGLLGGELLRRLLARTNDNVVAITRRPVEWQHPRLRLLRADLTDGPLPQLPFDIDTVVHCAASVAFDLPIDEQREINVEGTLRVLEAAQSLPNLERVMHVSTAYVGGTHEGTFGPHQLDEGQGFRNAYEQSKLEAELRVRASGLPFQVVRPSIVVGDQHTGETSSFNVIYGPLRAYSAGVLNVVPGRAEAPVDLIPVDVVVDGMLALLDEPAGDTHLLVAGPKAPTVGEFVERAAAHFNRPKAMLIDPDEIDGVIASLEPGPAASARRALDQAGALLPYFAVSTRFEDPATVAVLERSGIIVPHLADYLDRMIDFAVAARWGKRPGFYSSPVPVQEEVVS